MVKHWLASEGVHLDLTSTQYGLCQPEIVSLPVADGGTMSQTSSVDTGSKSNKYVY
jgi:hypothetical protein